MSDDRKNYGLASLIQAIMCGGSLEEIAGLQLDEIDFVRPRPSTFGNGSSSITETKERDIRAGGLKRSRAG